MLQGLRSIQTYRRAEAFTVAGEIEPGSIPRQGASVSIYDNRNNIPTHLLLMPEFTLPTATRKERRFMDAFAEMGARVRPFELTTSTLHDSRVTSLHNKLLSLVHEHQGNILDEDELLPVGYKFEPEIVNSAQADLPTSFCVARIALLGYYNGALVNTERICELRG